MITSIFSKSRPINFIIVFFVTLFAFVAVWLNEAQISFSTRLISKEIVLFLICYSTILLLNFIVSKNSLSKNSNYEILLFSLFLLAFYQATTNINILLSNFFVLLGLRRILSIRTQLNVDKKLFDAAFWITISAIFCFWSGLFFVLIIAALILYSDFKLSHWFIPFIGVGAVLLITIAFSIIINESYFGFFNSLPNISFDYSYYNSINYLVVITLLFSFGIWSSVFYVKSIGQKKKAFRATFSIILLAALIAFLIIVFVQKKDSSEFLFMFAPLSIIIANYIEIIEERWFKETFLFVLIILPFISLVI